MRAERVERGFVESDGAVRPRQTVKLIPDECWDLLRGTSVGRVVFTMSALPAIRPVNHLIDGRVIVIRSHLGAAITGHASRGGAVVAYEADDIDPVRHTGWSVIATGIARLVTGPDAISRYQQALEPWVARSMDQVIAITPETVTGIRLTDGSSSPGLTSWGDGEPQR